jgi:hypothetical protein
LDASHFGNWLSMATERQKATARRNLEKARAAQARRRGRNTPEESTRITTQRKNRLSDSAFAFPKERKEPLSDAKHVRNAIARFYQVEGVSNAERDLAWRRILSAARQHGVKVSESDWRDLFRGGKTDRNA